jgi:hypothetical protein
MTCYVCSKDNMPRIAQRAGNAPPVLQKIKRSNTKRMLLWSARRPNTVMDGDEVQRLARAGLIEEGNRPHIWRRSALRMRPGHYGERLRAARNGACPAAVKQIEKDLHRTFGSVHARGVRVPQAEALSSLRNVLLAYAAHNPAIG